MDLNSRIETQITEKNGAKFLGVELGGQNYELPFKLLAGRLVGFLDISGQVSLIESAAGELVKRLVAQGAQFDTILNPVSKSNALAHAIALKWTEATGQPHAPDRGGPEELRHGQGAGHLPLCHHPQGAGPVPDG